MKYCFSTFLGILSIVATLELAAQPAAQWPFAGGNLQNTRGSATENKIDIGSVRNLQVKWSFITGADISATPTVFGDALYVPDWGGHLYKFKANNGAVDWVKNISDLTNVPDAVSRTSPAISGNTVVIGTQTGGHIVALDASTGVVRWRVKADPNQYAIITQSPVIHKKTIYVGVSSSEEGVHSRVAGFVPTFRGSMLALDIDTGEILWRTYTVPAGYTGGAVWGSTPVIDERRNSLYITTGNNYTVPAEVQTCIDLARSKSYPTPAAKSATEEACLAATDYIDAMLALDSSTGRVKWARRIQGADTWTVACNSAASANPCPDSQSPDYDFGSGPNLFTVTENGRSFDLVGAGHKGGVYWAFNPDTGATVWATPVGPGGTLGGIEWGSATDGNRIYLAITNSAHKTYTLAGPTGTSHNAGSWAALDAATGRILWQVKVPGQDPLSPQFGALGMGAVSVANGVMFAGSTSGHMVALDGATGTILQTFLTAGSVVSGPSILNGTVYWGSGYGKIRTAGVSNTVGPQIFAFEVK